MITPPAGVRIYLACGVTDMRNYAERMIMQSALEDEARVSMLSTD